MTDATRVLEFDLFEVVFLALTLLLAGVHLSLVFFDPSALGARTDQFLLIGLAFLFGFFVRLTPYWRPMLYLLGAAFAIYLGALWLLGGTELFAIGVLTGIAAMTFIALALYLFVRDELRVVES